MGQVCGEEEAVKRGLHTAELQRSWRAGGTSAAEGEVGKGLKEEATSWIPILRSLVVAPDTLES